MLTTAVVNTELQYDNNSQRQFYGVITMPQGQVIPFVEFPQNPSIDIPAVNSIVLINIMGDYNAIHICKLVDANNDLSRPNLPLTPEGNRHIQPGEYQIAISAGSSIFLDLSGGISLHSSGIQNNITIDNDLVAIAGNNIDISGNADTLVAEPFLTMDNLCDIELGIRNPLTLINLHSITMDILGNIKLSNSAFGTIFISAVGTISLTSPLSISITAPAVSVTAAKVNVTSPLITLGGNPAQRLATESFVKLLYDIHTHGGVKAGSDITSPPIPTSLVLPITPTGPVVTLSTKAL